MRLLPQRHDHDHQGAAAAQPASVRDRDAGSAALQSLPLRRACRNHARGDARGGPCRRGRATDGRVGSSTTRASRGARCRVVRAAGAQATFETFIKITADGSVTAYNGHVDLGTGIRTALGQIVAEELDVSFARVVVVLGDTSRVPNQGATIASETIQITAVPLRKAAAQARQFLIARAAERLELPIEDLDDRGRPDPRPRQPQRQLWRIDRRRDHPPRTRRRRRGEGGRRLHASSASRCRASIFRPRRPANWSTFTTCACPACCTAAWCGRPMPASMPAPSSAPA